LSRKQHVLQNGWELRKAVDVSLPWVPGLK